MHITKKQNRRNYILRSSGRHNNILCGNIFRLQWLYITYRCPQQGCDSGGGGRDVKAGRHAGARPGGGPPGSAARRRALPGGVRRDDVLPAAEPVPGVPHLPRRLGPGPAHGQRLPHRALPGPAGRRPAAHEGGQVGGRQANPRHPRRQHRGPLPGTRAHRFICTLHMCCVFESPLASPSRPVPSPPLYVPPMDRSVEISSSSSLPTGYCASSKAHIDPSFSAREEHLSIAHKSRAVVAQVQNLVAGACRRVRHAHS